MLFVICNRHKIKFLVYCPGRLALWQVCPNNLSHENSPYKKLTPVKLAQSTERYPRKSMSHLHRANSMPRKNWAGGIRSLCMLKGNIIGKHYAWFDGFSYLSCRETDFNARVNVNLQPIKVTIKCYAMVRCVLLKLTLICHYSCVNLTFRLSCCSVNGCTETTSIVNVSSENSEGVKSPRFKFVDGDIEVCVV